MMGGLEGWVHDGWLRLATPRPEQVPLGDFG